MLLILHSNIMDWEKFNKFNIYYEARNGKFLHAEFPQ